MARKIPTALANANDTIAYLKGKITSFEARQEALYENIAIITHEVSYQKKKYDELYEKLDQGMFGPWSLFIQWAKEFEEQYKDREWGIDDGPDYLDVIFDFVDNKLNEVLGLDKPAKKIPNGKTKVQKRGANTKKVR